MTYVVSAGPGWTACFILRRPMFDLTQIRDHIAMVFDRAAGCDGKLMIVVFGAEQREFSDIRHFDVSARDIEAAVAWIASYQETPRRNVYMALSVFRGDLEEGKKGSEKDIVAVLGGCADMDTDRGKAGTMPFEPDYSVETSAGNYQHTVFFHSRCPSPKRKII